MNSRVARKHKSAELELTSRKRVKIHQEISMVTPINALPTEVLCKILRYLPLWARKDARLVCQKWFDALNIPEILNAEKIIGCDGAYGVYSITEVLSKSKRQFFNLEFSDLSFEEYPISFWREHGCKVRSLVFTDCYLSDETVYEFITHCTNLLHLSWIQSFCLHSSEQLFKKQNLEYLLEHNIKNNLDSLTISSTAINFLDSYPRNLPAKIIRIFPRIGIFKLAAVSEMYTVLNFSERRLKDFSEISDISYQKYHPRTTTELHTIPLEYNSIQNKYYSSVSRIRIRFSNKFYGGSPEFRVDFFWSDVFIKTDSISCSEDNKRTFGELLTLRIFHLYPELRQLELIWLDDNFYFTLLIFKKLIASKLNTFIIDGPGNRCGWYPEIIIDSDIYDTRFAPINKCLQHLRLYSNSSGINIRTSFYECCFNTFSRLKVLELQKVSPVTFRYIWRHQKNLTHLKMSESGSCGDPSFEEKNALDRDFNSFRSLKNLECLRMKLCKASDAVFVHFGAFSHLRFLSLEIKCSDQLFGLESTCNSAAGIFQIPINNLPLLTGVKFKFVRGADANFQCHTWVSFCQNFKRLRFLIIKNDRRSIFCHKSIVYKIFNHCPSLRIFQYDSSIYQYDIIRKIVKAIKYSPLLYSDFKLISDDM